MGVDYRGKDMTSHPQYITVRNERGQRMLDTVQPYLQTLPTMQVTAARPSLSLLQRFSSLGTYYWTREVAKMAPEVAGWRQEVICAADSHCR